MPKQSCTATSSFANANAHSFCFDFEVRQTRRRVGWEIQRSGYLVGGWFGSILSALSYLPNACQFSVG